MGQQMDLADLKKLVQQSRTSTGDGVLAYQICSDSREVKPGDIFVAIKGLQFDGHDFIAQAVENGASYIITEKEVELPGSAERIQVQNSAKALAEISRVVYDLPSKKVNKLAVTGTNGKTTVSYLTQAMLRAGQKDCGLIGTVEYDLGPHVYKAKNTTPNALDLAKMICQLSDAGIGHLVMECSSHGLDQYRSDGLRFSAAAFTNLSGDHLDYHGSSEAYFEAKCRLFEQLDESAFAVLNVHDPRSEKIAQRTKAKCLFYGINQRVDINAEILDMSMSGSSFRLSCGQESIDLHSPMLGDYNILNCLAASGLAQAIGVSLYDVASAIENFKGVPGRMQRVDFEDNFAVLVDYAHTDDALRHALHAINHLEPERLILVFGCGGDRDRQKRSRMACVAQQFADRVILTNDNPRFEDPDQIIADIQSGFSNEFMANVTVEKSRYAAIESALQIARRGDVVLIAGKGHEDYQDIEGTRYVFDDRQVARDILSGGSGAKRPENIYLTNKE